MLQLWVAIESEIVAWNRGPPDHDHDTKVIQLVAESIAFFAVV